MSDELAVTQDEKMLAGLAHGSILLGVFTSGFGGIIAALIIWLVQKEKSAYVAFQALQALVYQGVVFLLTMAAFCLWGACWMLMFMVPMMANSGAYEYAPPPSFWVGLALMVVPFAVWGLTLVYGIVGAIRCLGGHDFKYAIIGNWLES
jgi:uncharacterized Tic20 family protein